MGVEVMTLVPATLNLENVEIRPNENGRIQYLFM